MEGQAAVTLGLWVLGGLLCFRKKSSGEHIARRETRDFSALHSRKPIHILCLCLSPLVQGSARLSLACFPKKMLKSEKLWP